MRRAPGWQQLFFCLLAVGGPLPAGALRTSVSCLPVNAALAWRTSITLAMHSLVSQIATRIQCILSTLQYCISPRGLNSSAGTSSRHVVWQMARATSERSGGGYSIPIRAKSFDLIRFDSRYRIDFFDLFRFANLINLPLLHWYSNSNDGEFGEGPSGVSCAVVHSVPHQYQLDHFQQVQNV